MTDEHTPKVSAIIDGITVSVPKGTTVYQAASQIGIEIPIFCYMDRMPPFGACRMCLVEVEKFPKLQTSCTLEVTEGMVVHTKSDIAEAGRKGILEFLLINHPLDCPICDKGGECPLQDNTLKFGPGKSKFYEEKRHFKKPLPLGPVLMLDRERCIACARCTRFGEIIAGDHALEFIDRGYRTEVGTCGGGPAVSKFIGNTIKICPVGALTSQAYRFRSRPWDNVSKESTCTLCPVGCSMALDSREGEIVRTRSVENRAVNDVWLCDKGYFGYEFVDHPERLKYPLLKENDTFKVISWEDAFAVMAEKIAEASPKGKLAGFGGEPLTFEEKVLFQEFVRKVMNVNHVDHRIGTPLFSLEEEGLSAGMDMEIGQIEELSFVFLLGLDLTEEFPVIWLRLKQAINKGAKVVFIGHYAPEIASHLDACYLHTPNLEVEELKKHFPLLQKQLEGGKKGALFVGRQYLAKTDRTAILEELQRWKHASSDLTLNVMEGKAGHVGSREAGLRPDLAPLSRRIDNPGYNAEQVLQKAADQGWDFLYVVGADPVTHCPRSLWKAARQNLKFLVVQDLFLTKTAQDADLVLPTLSYLEKEGNFINIERRVQKIRPGKELPSEVLGDGEIFLRVAQKLGTQLSFEPKITEALNQPFFPKQPDTFTPHPSKKEEGALFATFAPALFDEGVRLQKSSHVAELTREPFMRIHPDEAKRFGVEEGQRAIVKNANGKCEGKIKLDRKVALKTIVIPIGFSEILAYELGFNLLNGVSVDLCP